MRRLALFPLICVLIAVATSACLVKYTYNQTGPEYDARPLTSKVLVFMNDTPSFRVDPVGILVFTDPLPRTAQIEEAKRHARQKGGNVLIRIKNHPAERHGGFAFRIARTDDATLNRIAQAMHPGSTAKLQGADEWSAADVNGGTRYGDFALPASAEKNRKDSMLFKYFVDP